MPRNGTVSTADVMLSVHERMERKQWHGELISFSPRPEFRFGLTDEHIRQQHIRAEVGSGWGEADMTLTRTADIASLAIGANKRRQDHVTLVLEGTTTST